MSDSRQEEPWKGITIERADRELLDPILGSDYMCDLMTRDRDAWIETGTHITRAFAAGKRAGMSADQPA